jgi:hypothetical protein
LNEVAPFRAGSGDQETGVRQLVDHRAEGVQQHVDSFFADETAGERHHRWPFQRRAGRTLEDCVAPHLVDTKLVCSKVQRD